MCAAPDTFATPIKLALISCGLGNVSRGFEVSTARWYEWLKDTPELDVRLICGGKYPGGRYVFNFPRDAVLNSPTSIFRFLNGRRYWECCYGVEQISFGLFLWPELVFWQPDVVWTKEVPFAFFLLFYRRLFNLKYKVIFANGGAFQPRTYKDFDYIQHLTPGSLESALQAGLPEDKMELLTNCIHYVNPAESRSEIRNELGYSPDDWVIISVAAWNCYHKRIDYLINEVALINNSKVKLLLCGHPESDTPMLKQLAAEKLKGRVKWLTLDEAGVCKALKAADVFVLPSLNEEVGNSLVEAVMAGLPVVTHDHTCSRFSIDDDSWICDLSEAGNLASRLTFLRGERSLNERIMPLKEKLLRQFGGAELTPRFCQMVKRVHMMPLSRKLVNATGKSAEPT